MPSLGFGGFRAYNLGSSVAEFKAAGRGGGVGK